MKSHRLIVVVVLVLGWLVVVSGASKARADGTCQATNVVFYSGDTVNLANALAAAASPCADYWISITPTNTGLPRDQVPLTTIHSLGPHFHAMAELRPKQWTTYAAANGWYATGVMLHDAMLAVGYDPTRDTWAVNEVGTPSDSPVNTDVFAGADGARQKFQDFVRGLYTGSSGPPMAGLVFAADPPQMTTDIWQYEQGLASWYSDAPFWQDMQQYVRFWAQETYADARSWGVDGASLTQRASYLNDYYLHGTRLAASNGEATATARAFFASAYTPLANATYRWPVPPDGGIGFGLTDIPLNDMLNFVSTQSYALRTSTPGQFGFAISAKNSSGSWNAAIYARIATSIRDSQVGPPGACTTAGESCDGVVAGAAFAETWRQFATPPTIISHVEGTLGAAGWYVSDATVSWDVSDAQTPVTSSPCEATVISSDTTGTPVECSATSSGGSAGPVTVTIKRDATSPDVSLVDGPTDGTSYYFGSVPAEPTCSASDATSGLAASCIVSGYSSAVGTHTVMASATDNAGNTGLASTEYTVLPWTLLGFFQPTDMNGVFNVVKNGSTVPLKFKIFAGSTELTDVADVHSLTTTQVTCDSRVTLDDVEVTATGGTALRYDGTAGQFVYNWQTPKTAGTCYRVATTILDGSSLAAYFKLK